MTDRMLTTSLRGMVAVGVLGALGPTSLVITDEPTAELAALTSVILALAIMFAVVTRLAAKPQPANRVRVEKLANRLVYGDRATPYEVLSDLTGRLADAESGGGLLDRVAVRLAEDTGAERAVVWLRGLESLRVAVPSPAYEIPAGTFDSMEDLPGMVIPIVREEEPLGALTVESSRGDALASASDTVTFAVIDNGDGFDPTTVTRGAGPINMEDRLGAIGGTLTIESTPGSGTTIAGSVGILALRPLVA